jgi:hypothetical protein
MQIQPTTPSTTPYPPPPFLPPPPPYAAPAIQPAPMRAPAKSTGSIAAALLAICAIGAMFLLLSHDWQRLGLGMASIGPRGIEQCPELFSGDGCVSYWWSVIPNGGSLPMLGILTLVTGAVAIGFGIASAALVFAKRLVLVPHRSGRVIVLLALAAAGAFQAAVSTSANVKALDDLGMTSPGGAGFGYLAVLVIAWFCLHRLARSQRTTGA